LGEEGEGKVRRKIVEILRIAVRRVKENQAEGKTGERAGPKQARDCWSSPWLRKEPGRRSNPRGNSKLPRQNNLRDINKRRGKEKLARADGERTPAGVGSTSPKMWREGGYTLVPLVP